jgi:hypothetical protein
MSFSLNSLPKYASQPFITTPMPQNTSGKTGQKNASGFTSAQTATKPALNSR